MIYIMILALSLFTTYFVKEYAIKKAIIDIPNDRSSHTIPTPRGGGIAIAISWFVGISYLFIVGNIDANLYFALMSGIIISVVSFFDDLKDLNPKIRLYAQVFVAIVGLVCLGGLKSIDFGLFSINNMIITNIIALFAIVWFINLYNFLDGINGYAGGEAVWLGLCGFVLFGNPMFLILVVASLGFLYFNFHKAKIFMGDVGSTLLGYNIAIFAIYYQNSGTSILVWLILFGLFWFDATITLFRRYKNKEKLSTAHRKHTYQRAVQSGLSHTQVVLFGMCVNIVLFAFAYIIISNSSLQLPIFILSLVFLYFILKLVDKRKKFE